MSKKPWHLDRRTFIRGIGVTCMLPFFEGMAMTTFSKLAELSLPNVYVFFTFQMVLDYRQKKVFTTKNGIGFIR